MIEITNIVGSGTLGVEVDIASVSESVDFPNTRYDPDKYHGIYIQYGEDEPLITLYRTGKYIVSGASDHDELHQTKERFLTTTADAGVIETAVDDSFQIQNIVATADVEMAIDLSQLAVYLGLNDTEYEPEQFPGLVYRPVDYDCVLLVFGNGKVVITGSKELRISEQAYTALREEVEKLAQQA